jgi:hypothetical protein
MEPNERIAYISGLRHLANALESNPEIQAPAAGTNKYNQLYFWFYGTTAKQDIVKTAKALGLKSYKKDFTNDNFRIEAELDGLFVSLIAYRKDVCIARVVGKKIVKQQVAVDYEEKLVEVDDVVWECPPLLAGEELPLTP